MRVLIADFDLFHKIGGGQIVYRQVIENNPHIAFYYFIVSEPYHMSRSPNAHPLKYKEFYSSQVLARRNDIDPPKWVYDAFIRASNVAANVAGLEFDVVEVGDYDQFGAFLRPALRHHDADFGRVVLSMHGCISTTISLNWSTEGKVNMPLKLLEEMQYRAVDTRYGISKSYIDEWRQIAGLEAEYLNPLQFVSWVKPTLTSGSGGLPSLNFIGRTEKRKGPDIFVELAWWLPRSSFSTANIIGPESYDPRGVGSGNYLQKMKRNRLKDINILPPMSHSELGKLFSSRAMVLLPSRYDTFNLLAIEALFSGCPTAIGSGAGVCRFLKETFPEVPFVTIDVNNIYSCIPEICSTLDSYDEYRERIVDAVMRLNATVCERKLEHIYRCAPAWDSAVRVRLERWYSQLIRVYGTTLRRPTARARATGVKILKSTTPVKMQRKISSLRFQLGESNLRQALKAKLMSYGHVDDARLVEQAIRGSRLGARYKKIANASEKTGKDLTNRLAMLWRVASDFRIDRARMWNEIARLERLRGNDLVAATYELRVIRALGEDRLDHLDIVVPTLEAHGLSREARAARAMYGPESGREQQCMSILEQALSDNRHNADRDYELLDDRRLSSAYRVSIIVSLYKAGPRLPLFVSALQNQTLVKAGAAELIFVETGSPDDDYRAFKEVLSSSDIPAVYVRVPQRETIQSAWNLGIALSRAPYLCFLGVDEAIVPDCLEVLATELDDDPTMDWVQGNSVVTQVDQHGSWMYDIMVYDRTGYRQDLAYLETCYLSWVGALYRRSLHDRFGYYDATFGAAGDTEFKNRVLPFIKTKHIPRVLGIFWNYPDERTTQSPRAEVEDLRAWYLHRTVAGVKYAFSRRDPSEVERLFYDCLRYRKSYCLHWSTDVEYAANLAVFLQEKAPDSATLRYAGGVQRVLAAYRHLEWLPKFSPLAVTSALVGTRRLISRVRQHQRGLGSPAVDPSYQIFNDNRHEQHSFLWKSDRRAVLGGSY